MVRTLARGHGFGLRVPHYPALLEGGAGGVDLVEAVTENFLGRGGRPRAVLARVRRDVPVVLHGVSLSIGAVGPLDLAYLAALRALCDGVEPAVVSDHLCFGRWGPHHGHDLWPLPYTEEALAHVVARVGAVQDRLGRRLALENVSSYVRYADSQLTEWDFLAEVARRADCAILLDINNVYVSARNHGFDPERYLAAIPVERVAQFHLAGHRDEGSYLLDDHGAQVAPPVWALHRLAVARFGAIPTIIEWDENVPSLEVLRAEVDAARRSEAAVLGGRDAQVGGA
jgi:uncharacterized protein (UPF0276 family)